MKVIHVDHVISLQAIDEGERLNVVYTVLAKGRSCVFSTGKTAS